MSAEDDFKSYVAISTQGILGTAGDLANGLAYPTDEYFSLTLGGAKRAVAALRKHANDLEGAIVRVENSTNSEEQSDLASAFKAGRLAGISESVDVSGVDRDKILQLAFEDTIDTPTPKEPTKRAKALADLAAFDGKHLIEPD